MEQRRKRNSFVKKGEVITLLIAIIVVSSLLILHKQMKKSKSEEQQQYQTTQNDAENKEEGADKENNQQNENQAEYQEYENESNQEEQEQEENNELKGIHVFDRDTKLDVATRIKLNEMLEYMQEKTGVQLIVIIEPTLLNRDPNEYFNDLLQRINVWNSEDQCLLLVSEFEQVAMFNASEGVIDDEGKEKIATSISENLDGQYDSEAIERVIKTMINEIVKNKRGDDFPFWYA